jgi:hypothetical protein
MTTARFTPKLGLVLMKCNPSLGVQGQSKNHGSFSNLFFEVPEAAQRPEKHDDYRYDF